MRLKGGSAIAELPDKGPPKIEYVCDLQSTGKDASGYTAQLRVRERTLSADAFSRGNDPIKGGPSAIETVNLLSQKEGRD